MIEIALTDIHVIAATTVGITNAINVQNKLLLSDFMERRVVAHGKWSRENNITFMAVTIVQLLAINNV